MTSRLIKPRTLKGFRDFLPEAMMPRETLMETARRVYRAYGFTPIDTPALEYLEILEGKGGEESNKQLYKFQDQGGRGKSDPGHPACKGHPRGKAKRQNEHGKSDRAPADQHRDEVALNHP